MNHAASPVVLLTDFGTSDIFTGVLKAVICSIDPKIPVIDLSHDVRPGDIACASFMLSCACAYFPEKSVFCVVIDPGVGSDRKGICIETRDYFFVGPDNGVMWAAASAIGIKRIIHLANRDFFLNPVSSTFHGRDIFAPVAARISAGLKDISFLGPSVDECVKYTVPEIKFLGPLKWELVVIAIDRFGNITLNITHDEFKNIVYDRKFCLTINNTRVKKYFNTYASADDNQCFLVSSSFSFMEIAVKNSSAGAKIKAKPMDRAVLEVFSSLP